MNYFFEYICLMEPGSLILIVYLDLDLEGVVVNNSCASKVSPF